MLSRVTSVVSRSQTNVACRGTIAKNSSCYCACVRFRLGLNWWHDRDMLSTILSPFLDCTLIWHGLWSFQVAVWRLVLLVVSLLRVSHELVVIWLWVDCELVMSQLWVCCELIVSWYWVSYQSVCVSYQLVVSGLSVCHELVTSWLYFGSELSVNRQLVSGDHQSWSCCFWALNL